MRNRPFSAFFSLFGVLILSSLTLSFASGKTPHFFILATGADFQSTVNTLKANKAKIQQRVPPRIIVAAIPNDFGTDVLPDIQSDFTGNVPLGQLEPLGPMAIAAGIQWNRKVKTMGGMKALGSGKMLPAPTYLSASQDAYSLQVKWETIYGASLYEIQVAGEKGFSKPLVQTMAQQPKVKIPLPPGFTGNQVAVRIRALDHTSEKESNNDTSGQWSIPLEIGVSPSIQTKGLTPPVITSPIENYESEGFTIILEWAQHQGDKTRVQVAKSDDFSGPLLDHIVEGREFVVPSPSLKLDHTYFCRVQAWGKDKSEWADVRSFHINQPHTIGTDMFINPEMPR